MDQERRLSPLGRGFALLERVEQGIAEASGPRCEAGPCPSSSEMPLGALQHPPLWGFSGAEPGRGKDFHPLHAPPPPPKELNASSKRRAGPTLKSCGDAQGPPSPNPSIKP